MKKIVFNPTSEPIKFLVEYNIGWSYFGGDVLVLFPKEERAFADFQTSEGWCRAKDMKFLGAEKLQIRSMVN